MHNFEYLFVEGDFREIAAKLQLPAKLEKTTPFCDIVADHTEEIKLALRLEKKNGRKINSELDKYETLFDVPVDRSPRKKCRNVKGKRILLKDDNGMGKISVMRRIEWDWAKGKFGHFRLVLLVSLRGIKSDDKLEDIIFRQNLQLWDIPLTPKKLRRIFEVYGHDCLLLLDGWGEYVEPSKDVMGIIEGDSLTECSLILSSRSEFVTGKISKYFKTVVKSEGFPQKYAETFANNILCNEGKVQTVLEIGIHDNQLVQKVNSKIPLYRNPALFLFVCIVLDDIKIPVDIDIGEIYFRTARFLYQRYSYESRVFNVVNPEYEKESAAWMTAFGKEAMKMLRQGPDTVSRQRIVESIGSKTYHWAIFTDHIYRFPTRNMPDKIHLIFPSFAIQEFFAAYFYTKYVKRKQEAKDETETHLVFGKALFQPKVMLNMSNIFQVCFNWLNGQLEKDSQIINE